MTEFSELLNGFVEQKKVKITPMAQFCGTDRATTYKYLNGKRLPPSEEVMEKMGEFMRLSPAEMRQLREQYRIARIGGDNYYRRQRVKEFLLSFPEAEEREEERKMPQVMEYVETTNEDCLVIQGEREQNRVLCQMLLEEARRENARIGLVLQPENAFLVDFLIARSEIFSRCRLEHVVCMDNSRKGRKKGTDNLVYLQQIVSMYMHMLDYHPYYYYDSVESHFYNGNLFPSMVLTSSKVFLFEPEEARGILLGQEEAVSMMKRQFEEHKSQCVPCTTAVMDGFEGYGQLMDIMEDQKICSIQADPCILPLLTPDMADRYVEDKEAKHRIKVLLDAYGELCSHWNPEDKRILITREGLEKFMETGSSLEIPASLGICFSQEDRLRILRRMIQEKRLDVIVLRELYGEISSNVHLCVGKDGGYLLFQDRRRQQIFVMLKEPGLLELFQDYMESLDEESFHSPQESRAILEEVLRQYKERWKL